MAMPSPMNWVWERFRNSFRGLNLDRSPDSEPDISDEETAEVRDFLVSICLNAINLSVSL